MVLTLPAAEGSAEVSQPEAAAMLAK